MINNTILDIIVSLVLIYALLSILVSILAEWVNQRQKTRSLFLKKTIFKLLNDPINVHFGELFYNHYLIRGFHNKDSHRLPQYISSRLFAEVLIDLIADRVQHDHPVVLAGENEMKGKEYQVLERKEYPVLKDRFETGLALLNPSPLTDTLHSFLDKSKDLTELKAHISFWFDDYMDRVSGWFKLNQRWKLRILGFVVAIGLNVDSLHLVKVISLDDALRSNLVNTAEKVADHYQALADSATAHSSQLLKTFQLSGPDSVQKVVPSITHLGTLLQQKDSLKYQQVKKLLHLNDSISRVSIHRADSVLGMAAALNIPIGWSSSSAPLSWRPFEKNHPVMHEGRGLLAYTERRNSFSTGSLISYLLGIFISGFSLSFGAPFWFDVLVKLINIRRAGKKPEAVNVK